MTASWLVVARKDLEDAIRSRTLLALVVLFTLFIVLITGLPGVLTQGSQVEGAVFLLNLPTGAVVPLLALIASYLAIAGERESGSLRLLLGLPPTRRDVLFGKFVGRSAVVLLSIGVAFLVGAVVMLLIYGDLPVQAFLVTAALTGLLAMSFVALAIGFSAGASSRSRAMAPAIGLYAILVGLWDLIVGAVDWVAHTGLDIELANTTLQFVNIVSPANAFGRLFNSLVVPGLAERIDGAINAPVPDTADAPYYLQDPFVIGLFLAWIVVPVLLGYWRFQRADLG